MEAKRERQKASTRGVILARCPLCKGKGKIPKEVPFLANPRAPSTRADKLGLQTCPQCNGSSRVGAE